MQRYVRLHHGKKGKWETSFTSRVNNLRENTDAVPLHLDMYGMLLLLSIISLSIRLDTLMYRACLHCHISRREACSYRHIVVALFVHHYSINATQGHTLINNVSSSCFFGSKHIVVSMSPLFLQNKIWNPPAHPNQEHAECPSLRMFKY